VRRRSADPGQCLLGSEEGRLLVRVEGAGEAHDAVMRHAAGAAADGDGGGKASAADSAGQGRNEILPNLERGMNEESFGGPASMKGRPI